MAGLPALHDRRPDLPIAILSGDLAAATMRAAFKAGANSFITKTMPADEGLAAMRLMLCGERYVRAGVAEELSKQSETLRGQVDGFLQKIRAA